MLTAPRSGHRGGSNRGRWPGQTTPLAQALVDRPVLLADGRFPAPRVVAELLIALRKAGGQHISLPVCAECGKHLRTFNYAADISRRTRDEEPRR